MAKKLCDWSKLLNMTCEMTEWWAKLENEQGTSLIFPTIRDPFWAFA